MKICVLQPDYSTSSVDYKEYDPPRDLSRWLPNDEVTHIFLNKLSTYQQLKSLQYEGYDIFINLCEGYLEWTVPSIDVIHYLDLLNLPYTGPNALLYDPPKTLMKYVAFCEGIATPDYVLLLPTDYPAKQVSKLNYPLFIKPAKAGDSLGINHQSRVENIGELEQRVAELRAEGYREILVETYIPGRELTVLVAADPDGKQVHSFQPVEYRFPEGYTFKTYSLKTSALHPNANIICDDPILSSALKQAAAKIFTSFQGVGYARMDFRVDNEGNIYFLEVNFTCSVFYTDGYEGSADYILQNDSIGQAGFLQLIIQEGINRHRRKQKKYTMRGNALAGYGIYAILPIHTGEIVFEGEGKSQRIITRRQVMQHWPPEDQITFNRYAYPLSSELFILWDDNPAEWAPQNHHCEPNTRYDGLNVIALKAIAAGEELTLDYGNFLDEHMQPFACKCGSNKCRGTITGKPGNTITFRESNHKNS
jgi:D-alanine-D-alanine ligase